MNQLTKKVMLGQPLELVYPRNFVFYADLWHPEQQGFLAYYDSNDYFSRTVANYRSADSEGAIEIWFRTSYTASYQALL